MTEMTGGEAVHRTLRALGVEHVFGIASVHNLPIYDAILRAGGIETIMVRHEQAGVHAADGYARATGRLGVALTSTGPGAANAVPGLYEAGFASSRVLMITGQIDSPYYRKGKGFLHEAENQLAMLRTVTRRAESPRFVHEIVDSILRVARDIQTGRPQPGCVEIPIDLQYASADLEVPETPDPPRIEPDPTALREAADLLRGAESRAIWCGGGVIRSEASAAVRQLAETLSAPVFTSVNGRGALPEDHALCMGPLTQHPEMQQILADADVLLAVGTRFQSGPGGGNWDLRLGRKLVHLDADPRVIGLNYAPDVAILGDARLGLVGIQAQLGDVAAGSAFAERAAAARGQVLERMHAQIGPDHKAIMDTIRTGLPNDAVIVRDSTVPAYLWADRILPILKPGTSMHPTSAAIGPGLPLAIGAALGTRKKTLLVQGDGGFMLHIGELATAAQYDLPIVICVFNDGGYGVLRRVQAMRFEGRMTGVDLLTPDFPTVARGMGLVGETVKGVDEFRAAFERALDANGPVLLDIDMGALAPMELFAPPPRRES